MMVVLIVGFVMMVCCVDCCIVMICCCADCRLVISCVVIAVL